MADYDFPDDLYIRCSSFVETWHRPMVVSEMEDGPIHSRPRWTAMRRKFSLTLTLFEDADRQTLLDFLDDVGGDLCNFLHPTTGEEIEVFVDTQNVQLKYLANNRWTVQLDLVEAMRTTSSGGSGS